MQHFNIHPFIGLHSSECTYGGLSVRQLLPAEWKIALGGQTDFSEFFFFLRLCTARFSVRNLLYVMLSEVIFFCSPWQRKINCKEDQKFVFKLAWWSWMPGMEEDSCGGRLADPLPSASPMPCCTESVTKQASRNTGQILRASLGDLHRFPIPPQPKKLHTPKSVPTSVSKLNGCLCISLPSKIWHCYDCKMPLHSVTAYMSKSSPAKMLQKANKHLLITCSNNAEQEIRSSML